MSHPLIAHQDHHLLGNFVAPTRNFKGTSHKLNHDNEIRYVTSVAATVDGGLQQKYMQAYMYMYMYNASSSTVGLIVIVHAPRYAHVHVHVHVCNNSWIII